MIHFQCQCGRTHSVPDEDRDAPLLCPGCGATVRVPMAAPSSAARPGEGRTPSHDFDAELSAAVRTTPPRRLRLVNGLPEAERGAGEGGEDRPRRGNRWLLRAPLALTGLAVACVLSGIAGAGLLLGLIPSDILSGRVGAVVLLVVGACGFVGLLATARALAEVRERLAEGGGGSEAPLSGKSPPGSTPRTADGERPSP